MWYLYDALPRYPIAVRNFLKNTFLYGWVGRGSEKVWSPRNAYLNVFDLVYFRIIINTRDEL